MTSVEYLRDYNLVSTRSVGRMDDIIYSEENTNLASTNYTNCINVYNLINDFNREYQEFKKEYSELESLDELKKYNLAYYYETPTFQTLRYVNHLNMLNFLNIGENYKLIKSSVHNLDGKENLNLDSNIVKKYLEFGKKYQCLINKYNVISTSLSSLNLNNGVVMSLLLDKQDINDLKYLVYSFGIYNIDFILTFNLGNELSLDYISNASLYKFSDEQIVDIAKHIYLDKSFVYGLDAFNEDKKLIKK